MGRSVTGLYMKNKPALKAKRLKETMMAHLIIMHGPSLTRHEKMQISAWLMRLSRDVCKDTQGWTKRFSAKIFLNR